MSKLTLTQLKERHPELVRQLKAEHRREYDAAHGGSLEQAAADQISAQGKIGKPLNTKPEHSKTEEEKAGDQIAGKAGVRKR